MTHATPTPTTSSGATLPGLPVAPGDDADRFRQQMAAAQHLADQHVLLLVSTCPLQLIGDGVHWYDASPLTDLREVSPASADRNALALAYGIDRHILLRHPVQGLAHLVGVYPGTISWPAAAGDLLRGRVPA